MIICLIFYIGHCLKNKISIWSKFGAIWTMSKSYYGMLHLFQTHKKNFPFLFRFLVKFCSLNNNLADKSLLSALVMQTRFKLSKYKQNISKFWKEIMNNRRCVWNIFLLWICPFHIEAKLIFTDILNDTLCTGIMLHLHLGKLVP